MVWAIWDLLYYNGNDYYNLYDKTKAVTRNSTVGSTVDLNKLGSYGIHKTTHTA